MLEVNLELPEQTYKNDNIIFLLNNIAKSTINELESASTSEVHTLKCMCGIKIPMIIQIAHTSYLAHSENMATSCIL